MELDSHKFACAIAQFLDDKLGKDIVILNISNVSSLADYFVMEFNVITIVLLRTADHLHCLLQQFFVRGNEFVNHFHL